MIHESEMSLRVTLAYGQGVERLSVCSLLGRLVRSTKLRWMFLTTAVGDCVLSDNGSTIRHAFVQSLICTPTLSDVASLLSLSRLVVALTFEWTSDSGVLVPGLATADGVVELKDDPAAPADSEDSLSWPLDSSLSASLMETAEAFLRPDLKENLARGATAARVASKVAESALRACPRSHGQPR